MYARPRRPRPQGRRQRPAAAAVVVALAAALAAVWAFLLAAVLRHRLTDDVAGMHAGADAGTLATAPAPHRPRYRHACTCLNETTLSSFANNPAHPFAAPLPYGFEWLHIPKTGSSFAATLWSFACTRRGRIDLSISNDVGGSQALPWSKNFLFHDLYGKPSV